MINGVDIKKIKTHVHDRGNFREILRDDDKLLKKFGQASITVTHPGVIKAFHWHKKQDDLWYGVSGDAKVVLYDLRKDSKTKGETMEICIGENAEPEVCPCNLIMLLQTYFWCEGSWKMCKILSGEWKVRPSCSAALECEGIRRSVCGICFPYIMSYVTLGSAYCLRE